VVTTKPLGTSQFRHFDVNSLGFRFVGCDPGGRVRSSLGVSV
jgi:hypothetical protein